MDTREKTREHFNRTAACYDASSDGRFVRPMYAAIVNEIARSEGGRILDVGCGNGNLFTFLPKGKYELFGVDFAESMIEEARKNTGPEASYLVADAEDLPFARDVFDIVVCNASFHHYVHPDAALSEMRRVLKEGGKLLLGDPYPPALLRPVMNLVTKRSSEGDHHYYGMKEMKNLLVKNGFAPVSCAKTGEHTVFYVAEKTAAPCPEVAVDARTGAVKADALDGSGVIRPEREEDRRAVEELIRRAFWNVYRPGCSEHYVIHVLRNDPAFVGELDFVMESGGQLIGQNMFMKTVIEADDGRTIPVLTMGPICVAPEHKGKGLGKALLDYSLDKAAGMGFGAVLFEGNIGFYGKSGFSFAEGFGIRYHDLPKGEDASFFLCKELIPGYLDGVTGVYQTPRGYYVDDADVEEFDKGFPAKEKLKLPGQIF